MKLIKNILKKDFARNTIITFFAYDCGNNYFFCIILYA